MIDAVSHLLPTSPRTDPDVLADVEDILDAAQEWQAGRMDLNALLHLGTIAYNGRPSARYSRFVAVATTSPDDPRRAALLAAIDRISSPQGQFTRQGFFTRDEQHQHDAAVRFVQTHGRAPWEQAA